MTVEEFLAWLPPGERGCWELIDGRPRWRGHRRRMADIVAWTPEELVRVLEAAEATTAPPPLA
jgi:hypothetical protein